ncbi:hypothetical protein BABINDRAFT_170872 [Babjeviella inositovora NRRL Y-12698]|uniref:Threonine dehydratase n=1 Tax=Babjeviella inositovora NRRL Y-12698 TaxID=984486 RepID=A0A1E3QUF9_9ASCO|nr:uncharacterized protein BABINDRAFT_170872 [Babjeviella inositovora NRRL Y-12698]ODQ81313.1 hypothetical protein BABINDRAFT_170872 [Babjeviella inositovora NRRL Y-12698]
MEAVTLKGIASSLQKQFPTLKDVDFLPSGRPDYVKMILTSRVYDVIDESPVTPAHNLSQKTGSNVILKREDLLPVFSFKLRGAYNMIAQLPAELAAKGVIACSAGNHAQGVAYSAQCLDIPATIVMPTATPSIKYKNVSRLGSQVVLFGQDFDSAKGECQRLSSQNGLTNIPPFDHPYVIAGQGTIAMELLRQVKCHKMQAIFCAVGGGGLISGVAAYMKRLMPHVKVIGVETYDADALYQSLAAGSRVDLETVGLFADGTAVKVLGEETLTVAREYVDEVVRVSTDEICAAIKDVFEDTRSVVEPSGAMAVAGMKRYITDHPEIDHSHCTYIPVLSGANMNFDRLRFVSERAMLGEGKEVFMMVKIPEKPGSFLKLISAIDPRNVTEFSYRHNGTGDAYVYTSFSVSNRKQEVAEVTEELVSYGFDVMDISDNELAKDHGRYLVGGVSSVANERVISFEFPEKPGALTKFLERVNCFWNITLFHYRNQGGDVGRVLAALSVPVADNAKFDELLKNLGYSYVEETDNVVYQKFLKGN